MTAPATDQETPGAPGAGPVVCVPVPVTVRALRAALRGLPAVTELGDVLLGGTTVGFVGVTDLVDLELRFAPPVPGGAVR